MDEKSRKRKEWVKSAAIVFLTVMLILTFFSNTIMNYSLPEVAVQYVQSGTVTSKIRGNGIVESGDPYSVKIKNTRTVESVEVAVGDKVEKGQVLCVLSSEDSAELEAAKAALEAAQLAYDQAVLGGTMDNSVLNAAGSNVPTDTYKNQIITLRNEITAAQAEVDAAQAKVEKWEKEKEAFELQINISGTETADTSKETDAVNKAQKVLDEKEKALEAVKTELTNVELDIEHEERLLSVSSGDQSRLDALKAEKLDLQGQQKDVEKEYNNAKNIYYNAEKALKEKADSEEDDKNDILENLNSQLSAIRLEIHAANRTLNEKQAVLDNKKEKLTELVKNVNDRLNLSTLYDAVADARKEVAKLEETMEGSEVCAPISGTVMTINAKSGLETPSDGILFTLQRVGEGYTMNFSVTNAQAQRLSVGDIAEPVNSWRYDNMEIVLKTIRPDPSNPQENKLLIFDVTGENVAVNQSINVSVGQKSSTYDMTVPNSAVREDNNGKFILIVETKSTPLSNRYIAKRVDVQVLASDDTNSAISGDLRGWEYVMTTATKPVEAGQQVRLSEK